jgi:subtilisin family serine protease
MVVAIRLYVIAYGRSSHPSQLALNAMAVPADRAGVRRVLIAGVVLLAAFGGAGASTANAAIDPLRSVQWALDAIHLRDLVVRAPQAVPAGEGALVAVVDSGVDSVHPDLAGRVVRGPDFVDGDGGPDDPNGHGTHIAGIVAAAAGNGIGGAGVAPAARILAIRVLDANNGGSPANVAAGINAAIAARADVINLSLNWSAPSAALTPVTEAIRRAADAGIAVIVASGNDAQPQCEEPFVPQRTLCVGAVDGDLRLASFSSHGGGLGIVAPGEDLVSTWHDDDYISISGTSQAAAVTSGVAALLVGLGLHGQAVIDRLIQTARDIGTPGPDLATGHGLLDADRAVEGAAEGTLPPLMRITAARRATAGVVRARGLKVSCDAARPGTCRVRLRVGSVVVAKGSTRADGTGSVGVLARATAAGRRLLGERRSRNAVVEAALAGAPGARRTIKLRAR